MAFSLFRVLHKPPSMIIWKQTGETTFPRRPIKTLSNKAWHKFDKRDIISLKIGPLVSSIFPLLSIHCWKYLRSDSYTTTVIFDSDAFS